MTDTRITSAALLHIGLMFATAGDPVTAERAYRDALRSGDPEICRLARRGLTQMSSRANLHH